MEKVCKAELPAAEASLPIMLEAMRPLRHAPTGTSAIRWARTVSLIFAATAHFQSSSDRDSVAIIGYDQYRLGSACLAFAVIESVWAGGSFFTLSKMERFAGIKPNAR